MNDPRVDGLLKDIAILKRRMDDLPSPEISLGLTLIAPTQTLTGSAASVTFSSISQDFKHLLLKCQARTDRAAENDLVVIRFNADSGANYDRQLLTANNATLSGAAARAQTFTQIGSCEAANSRASNFSPTESQIFGYSRTDAEKWQMSRSTVFGDVSADADLFINFFGGRWRSTAAISSIVILPGVGPNFVSGSIFQLYGVK